MTAVAAAGIRTSGRYSPVMATQELLGIKAVRMAMAERLQKANDDAGTVHTVVLVDSKPRGVLVSVDWRRRAAEALNEPIDLGKVPTVGVTDFRDNLGSYVGTSALVVRRTTPQAVLVPWDWYLRASKAMNEPVDF